MNSIYSIAKRIIKITDAEIQELEALANEQMNYVHPLKLATQARQNELGRFNNTVLIQIAALRLTLKTGPQQ